jgi:hypothetical protein
MKYQGRSPVQGICPFPPRPRGYDPVPVSVQVFGPNEEQVDISLDRQVLKSVVQDIKIRSYCLPGPLPSPFAAGIDQHTCIRVIPGKHQWFIAC